MPVPCRRGDAAPLFRERFFVSARRRLLSFAGALVRGAPTLSPARRVARRPRPCLGSRWARAAPRTAPRTASGRTRSAVHRVARPAPRRRAPSRRPPRRARGRSRGGCPRPGSRARSPSRGPAIGLRGAPDRARHAASPTWDRPRADPQARVTRGDVVGDPDASWYAPLDAPLTRDDERGAPETRERVRRLGDAADAETRREFVRGFLRDLVTPGAALDAAAAGSTPRKKTPGANANANAKILAPDIHRVIRAKTEEKVLLLDAAEVRADAAEARAREDAAERGAASAAGRTRRRAPPRGRRLGDPLALIGNPLLGNHEDDTPPVVGGKGSSRGASARNNSGGGDGAAAGRRRRNGSLARGAPRPGLFSALAPLRTAWAAYSRSAFPERKNAVTPSVDASACLGARVVVTSHADPTWVRVEGVLARVGAGAAFLVSEDDRVRAVPRRGAELEARLEGGRAVRVKYP